MTPKQKRFCREYVIDFNGTQAAIRAGYSEHSAFVIASQLLRLLKVQKAVAELTAKQAAKQEITAERVLAELARLAFHDPRKFFNADGSLKDITALDDETAMAVAGMDVYEEFEGRGKDRASVGQTKKLKLADKGQNLERLGRYLKLFTDNVNHSGDVTVACVDRLLNARKRVAGSQDDREREA